MGINNASLAIYYAEITPKGERGGVVAMTEVFFAVGGICACLAQLVLQDMLVTPPEARNAWRALMGLEAIPGFVMFLGALRCCESPHWLLRRGNSAEAERVMHLIYRPRRLPRGGCDCAERNADLADALEALKQTQTAEMREAAQQSVMAAGRRGRRGPCEALSHTMWELVETLGLAWSSPVKHIRRALELNLWMASMPLIGIGCIPQQFVPLLLEEGQAKATPPARGYPPGAHHHTRPPLIISRDTLLIDLACNVVYVVGSLITCLFLVDRFGRRGLLCVCLFAASVGFALDALTQEGQFVAPAPPGRLAVHPPKLEHPGRHTSVVLLGVILGYVARAMGVGPLHQVVGSEVVPQDIAARGKALYAMARRGSAMLFCLLFPPLLASVGGARIFAALAAATFVYFLVVWLRLPETKGYDAREVEHLLEGHSWIPFAKVPPPSSPNAWKPLQVNMDAFSWNVPPAMAEDDLDPRGWASDAPASHDRVGHSRPKGRLATSKSFVMAVPDLGA
jgi:MFS family permease